MGQHKRKVIAFSLMVRSKVTSASPRNCGTDSPRHLNNKENKQVLVSASVSSILLTGGNSSWLKAENCLNHNSTFKVMFKWGMQRGSKTFLRRVNIKETLLPIDSRCMEYKRRYLNQRSHTCHRPRISLSAKHVAFQVQAIVPT